MMVEMIPMMTRKGIYEFVQTNWALHDKQLNNIVVICTAIDNHKFSNFHSIDRSLPLHLLNSIFCFISNANFNTLWLHVNFQFSNKSK